MHTYINLTGFELELWMWNGKLASFPAIGSAVNTAEALPAPEQDVRFVITYETAQALATTLSSRHDIYCPDRGGSGYWGPASGDDAAIMIRRPATDLLHPNVPYRCEPLRCVARLVFAAPVIARIVLANKKRR